MEAREEESLDQQFYSIMIPHLMKYQNMSPLSARIFSLLLLNKNRGEGLCFEEIVSHTGASKSSVSNNLNLLSNANKIEYQILNTRTKYFRIRGHGLITRVKEIQELIIAECQKIEEIMAVIKPRYNEEEYNKKIKVSNTCRDFMEKIKTLLSECITTMEQQID